MTIATGVNKQLRYKKEVTWGTLPGVGSAQLLRRVTSNLSLKKDTYQSNEIRSDFQVADFRHGVRKVEGAIAGELSPGTYADFYAAALRKLFAATAAITGASITIAGSGPTYTVTRAAGSFLTDGVKIGDVIRLSVGSFNAANIAKNLVVVGLTATVATVVPLNGVALVAEGPIATSTVTVIGKKTFTPTTGHTDDSFSIEHWHNDVAQSEVFSGCKVSKFQTNLPPTGMATATFDFMGKDVTAATAQYYTSPTAATTSGVLAAVNGIIYAGGNQIALLTGLQLNYDGAMTADPVVGSNTYPDIFEGRVVINGQMTAFFQDATLRDYFLNETEVSIFCAFATGNAAAADFIGFNLPRVKCGGSDKDDGEKGIVQTIPFTALFNSLGGAGTATDQSTLIVQDSLAP
jgi:hypothetical protein